MKTLPERAAQRASSFKRAFAQLESATARTDFNELETAGLVQTFEFTFELLWKLLKDICEDNGFTLASPKDIIRQSAQLGLVHDPEILLDALEKRNVMAHTYNESTARESIAVIQNTFEPEIRNTITKIATVYDWN